MDHKLAHLSEHVVPVIPHTVESQHFPVHLQELTEFVEVGGRLECLQGSSTFTVVGVWVSGAVRGRVDLNTLAL